MSEVPRTSSPEATPSEPENNAEQPAAITTAEMASVSEAPVTGVSKNESVQPDDKQKSAESQQSTPEVGSKSEPEKAKKEEKPEFISGLDDLDSMVAQIRKEQQEKEAAERLKAEAEARKQAEKEESERRKQAEAEAAAFRNEVYGAPLQKPKTEAEKEQFLKDAETARPRMEDAAEYEQHLQMTAQPNYVGTTLTGKQGLFEQQRQSVNGNTLTQDAENGNRDAARVSFEGKPLPSGEDAVILERLDKYADRANELRVKAYEAEQAGNAEEAAKYMAAYEEADKNFGLLQRKLKKDQEARGTNDKDFSREDKGDNASSDKAAAPQSAAEPLIGGEASKSDKFPSDNEEKGNLTPEERAAQHPWFNQNSSAVPGNDAVNNVVGHYRRVGPAEETTVQPRALLQNGETYRTPVGTSAAAGEGTPGTPDSKTPIQGEAAAAAKSPESKTDDDKDEDNERPGGGNAPEGGFFRRAKDRFFNRRKGKAEREGSSEKSGETEEKLGRKIGRIMSLGTAAIVMVGIASLGNGWDKVEPKTEKRSIQEYNQYDRDKADAFPGSPETIAENSYMVSKGEGFYSLLSREGVPAEKQHAALGKILKLAETNSAVRPWVYERKQNEPGIAKTGAMPRAVVDLIKKAAS